MVGAKTMKEIVNKKRLIKIKNLGCQMDIRETNSDNEMERNNLQIFTLKKNVLRQLLFLEIVSVTKIKKLFGCMCIKWLWGSI